MKYEIVQEPLPARTLLCKQIQCLHAEVTQSLALCLPAAYQFAVSNDIPMQGPPITRYAEWGAGVVTLQGGVPVPAGTVAGEGLVVIELPETTAATTVHTGPYEGLSEAHAALEAFLLENGLESGGPAVEVYLTDPGEVPDPKDWKTSVQKPLRS